jgi:hypothetical protein
VQGKTVWILAFLAFLSALNTINAVFMSVTLGIEGTFTPALLSGVISDFPVWVYLLLSVIVTFIFIGAACVSLVTELSTKALLNEINAKVNTLESGQKLQQKVLESLQARVFLVDESVNSMRKEIAKAFTKQDEELKQVQASLTKKLDSELADVKEEMAKQISEQREEIKKINTNMVNLFTKNLTAIKDELAGQIAGIAGDMASHERRNRKTEKAISDQQAEITEIKSTIQRIEEEFVAPKPLLTSDCKVEDVRGIGENTGNELREVGITDVGELVLTDAGVIADRTEMSEKMVEKLQGRAQLAMIPGIKEKDLILLEEAEVMNRKDLANQDPFELGKRINEIAKVYLKEEKIADAEIPTIEEIDAWIKRAKS